MKTITKPNTNYRNSRKMNEALSFFSRYLEVDTRPDRFLITMYTDNHGDFYLYDGDDNNANYGLALYEEKGDVFFVPGFADETWSGVSLYGQDYILNAEMMPVIEEV